MINFSKKINIIDKKYMVGKYYHLFNENNFYKMNFRYVKKIFNNEDKKIVEKYIFYIFNQFVEKHYEPNEYFFKKIKYLIKKYKLNLNDLDIQELRLLEERAFSLDRHIKTLALNLKLDKHENAHVKFTHAQLYRINRSSMKTILKGNLIFTNKRILVFDKNNNEFFYWKKISNESSNQAGFYFEFDKKKYLISIHDNETLGNTLLNLKRKINIIS